MHLVRALVFLVDPLEHFISLASARDELIFYFGLPGRLFWWFVVEGSSLSRRFLQGRHGTSDSDEGHDFDCFQCICRGDSNIRLTHLRLDLWAVHPQSPKAAWGDALKRTEDGAGRAQSSAAGGSETRATVA